MSGWLLDTNVLSELRKPRCNKLIKQWVEDQSPSSFYISSISIAEIRYGIERVEDLDFKQELSRWLDFTLRPWFADRILEIDEDIILRWRQMVAEGRRNNYTFSQPDLFIAAQADFHQLCVVTRNVSDFTVAAVSVLNPWEPQSGTK